MNQTHSLVFLILVGVIGGVGAYFGAYLKEKGKNLATQEDINKLVQEMSAVTEATKRIEADISSEVWDRQRHWELKRDALLETVKRMAAIGLRHRSRLAFEVYKELRSNTSTAHRL